VTDFNVVCSVESSKGRVDARRRERLLVRRGLRAKAASASGCSCPRMVLEYAPNNSALNENMSEIALQLEYAVEVDVSAAFAWQVRTDVTNWNDPPATFVLDDPFQTDSCGTTLMPGQPPRRWWIQDVKHGR
jgi:hypothetical protein